MTGLMGEQWSPQGLSDRTKQTPDISFILLYMFMMSTIYKRCWFWFSNMMTVWADNCFILLAEDDT